MLKRILILTGLIVISCWELYSQTATLTGFVKDKEGMPLEFVNLAIEGTTQGTTSDESGYFELDVPAGKKHMIIFSFVGYEKDTLSVTLASGEMKKVNVILKQTAKELSTVEVKDAQLRTSTFNRIDPKSISIIPTINASVEDIIKTLPGVSSRDELSSQYSVRGGNYDENLIFVNDIEVYRPFLIRSGQQEGMSFLNPDLVSGILFSAGGFDAKYGDKMASVLDIRYRKPSEFAASLEVSMMGAKGHIEGTLAKKKISFLLGTRYKTNTYFLKSLELLLELGEQCEGIGY